MQKILLSLALVISIFLKTNAQNGILQKELDKQNNLSFVTFHSDSTINLKQSQYLLKKNLRLKDEDEMRVVKTEKDDIGFVHQFHDQYYKGIKVAFSSFKKR